MHMRRNRINILIVSSLTLKLAFGQPAWFDVVWKWEVENNSGLYSYQHMGGARRRLDIY